MQLRKARKGMTMIETVLVIALLSLLGLVAYATYSNVFAKAKSATLEQTVGSFEREYRALQAFNAGGDPAGSGAVILEATEDMAANSGVVIRTEAGAGTDGVEIHDGTIAGVTAGVVTGTTDSDVATDATRVLFSKGDVDICLTVPASFGAPGVVDKLTPATSCADVMD